LSICLDATKYLGKMRGKAGRVVREEQRESAGFYLPQVSALLVSRLVIASSAAGLAVKKAVGAEPDVNHGLAEAAVLFALAS
jgi:hypothetical protein